MDEWLINDYGVMRMSMWISGDIYTWRCGTTEPLATMSVVYQDLADFANYATILLQKRFTQH